MPMLSWTHYRVLLQVNDSEARDWYATEAATQNWSVKTLQRNISSQYYYRMLPSINVFAYRRRAESRDRDAENIILSSATGK